MQPFFKSRSGAIIPFGNVTCVRQPKQGDTKLNINIKQGPNLDTFTFVSIEDKNIQLKNYENYLINQYKLKELL